MIRRFIFISTLVIFSYLIYSIIILAIENDNLKESKKIDDESINNILKLISIHPKCGDKFDYVYKNMRKNFDVQRVDDRKVMFDGAFNIIFEDNNLKSVEITNVGRADYC
jgi:hypothetical protein